MQTNATNPKKKFTQPLPDAGYMPPDATNPTNTTGTAGSTTVKPTATVTTTPKATTTPATTVNPIATNIPAVQTQTPQASTAMNEMNSFIQEQSKTTMAQPEKDAFEAAKTMDELNAGIKYNQAQADIQGEEEQRLKLYRDTTKALERGSEDFTNTMRRSVMDMTNLQNQNANMVHNLTFARNGAEYGASIKGIQAVNTVLAQAQNELQQARFESDINMRRLGEDYSQQVIEMTRNLYRNIDGARLKMYETMNKMQIQGKLEDTRDIRHAQQMLADQYTKDLKLYMDTHAQSAQFAFQKYQYDKQQSMQERQLAMNGIELIKQSDGSVLQYDKINQKFINTSPLEAFSASKFGIADDGKGGIRVNVNSAADFVKVKQADGSIRSRGQCGEYVNDALGTKFANLIADKKAMINSQIPVPGSVAIYEFPTARKGSDADLYGHVAIVENTGVENGKRYIDISDANANGLEGFRRTRIYEGDPKWWNTIVGFHIPQAAQKMAQTVAAQKTAAAPQNTDASPLIAGIGREFVESGKIPSEYVIKSTGMSPNQLIAQGVTAFAQGKNKTLEPLGLKISDISPYLAANDDQRKAMNKLLVTIPSFIQQVDRWKQLVDEYGTEASWTEKGSEMEQLRTSILTTLKSEEFYNLGVLQKIDLDFMEGLIPNTNAMFMPEWNHSEKLGRVKEFFLEKVRTQGKSLGFGETEISPLDA